MKPLRIFITCAPQDLPYAKELRNHLAAAGYQPWLEDTSAAALPPGPERDAANREAIKRADAFLIPLTPYALAWPGLRREWQLARLQRKPVLLLLVHSVSSAALLSALQPASPAAGSAMDGELLNWIDVRDRPAEAAWRAQAWLENRYGAQHDLLPSPVEPSRFFAEIIPRPARVYAWSQLTLAALGIALSLVTLIRLVILQLGRAPIVFLDQFFITLLIALCGAGILVLAKLGRNGMETFRRRCKSPGEILLPLQRLIFLVAWLLGLLGLATYFLGKTALLAGSLYPAESLFFGLFLALAGGIFFLPQAFVNRFVPLRAWLPCMEPPAPQPGLSAWWPVEAEILPPNGNGNRLAVPVASRPAGHRSISPARKPPLPSSSHTGASASEITPHFRLALPGGHIQPAFAGGNSAIPANFGLINAIHDSPYRQVSVLFAPQDAPFGRSLEHYLGENGLRVHEDISESIQAHVNARIHVGSSNDQGDATLILVLSPWAKETASLRDYWQSAQAAGMPILPVLLEDTILPNEIGHLQWVDARRDLSRARQQILETVMREREEQSMLPAAEQAQPASAQPAGQRRAAILPRSVQFAQWGLFFSSALKMIVLAILFPMTLWMRSPLNLGLGLAAGLLFVTTYIQLIAVMLFFMRRLSYPWMLLIQGDCLLVGAVALPFLQSVLLWPVSTLARITLLFPVWEAVVFLWLLLVADIRHWALGGFWLRLQNLEVSFRASLYSLAPLFIALLFTLPAIKAGPPPQLRTYAGKLSPGEIVLVRILPHAPIEPWTFHASQGELVTIQADGGFNTSQITYNLSLGKRILAWSRPTLGSSNITGLLLPEDGTYTIRLVNPPSEGLFRFSYTTRRLAQPQALACGESPSAAHLDTGQTLVWKINASRGVRLQIQMDAQGWTLDPWISLYDPAGNRVAGDDDGGHLLDALLPAYYATQSGAYTLLTSSRPGTSGNFQLVATCFK